ncbi:CheR family methyltransferase [Zunongwangia sp. F260]|uniref:histidine kinase n=1 Tax=Autumnicola lenta TaxID=3075593 RepID=A0ABU3CH97_9FLAO|nr:CheR family methyltransferase [Zunongwangia sp. F260]MDT0645723.1 CheR family methyltransferase [Zunongwangia sp. F260]
MSQENKKSSIESLKRSENNFPVVGVGASAGGLAAFKEFIQAIPKDSGMAYVLVQHLDPNHESLLPELLQKCSELPILEISNDLTVKSDHIYIIPTNKMLMSNDGKLELSPRPQKAGAVKNLPIDLFFKSLAEVHQEHSIGVILTGNGADGTAGFKAIKDNGGITFAQSEDTAEYPSMPRCAIEEGVVDFILSPREMPAKILEVVENFYGINGNEKELENEDVDVYKQILALLRIRKGIDFTYYKQTTIRRRILRRMALSGKKEPADYLKFLREHKHEQDILQQDLLIPVTEFFRDEEIFNRLSSTIFPEILKNKSREEAVRIWVAGCSTGQEVYSVAICLHEFMEENESSAKVQIFGTDISEPAIGKARNGIYKKSELENLNPQRVGRFFNKVDSNYQIKKEVREMCIFSLHNFLKDPPFGKMDVIACRNVLIYLQPYLQKKALTTFHYALKRNGYLLLGKSETTGNAPDLFIPSEKNHKIFKPKDRPGKFMQVASQRKEENFREFSRNRKAENAQTDFQRTADEVILSRYTPAGVVIDEAMDIVHFRGRTGPYLEPQSGKPNLNLLRMAKPGLSFELRSIIHHAKKENESVIRENIPVPEGNGQRIISIEAIPLPNLAEPYYLVLFHDPLAQPEVSGYRKVVEKISSEEPKEDEKDLLIHQLEKELAQAREDMRSITEDQEATNEELQSANEELQSGSEELQTLNEELETSKEELQSTNEELTSLNQELLSMNKNLTTARNFAVDILETVREPWLVLDSNLRIKSANNVFYKTFRTSEAEIENKSVLNLSKKEWSLSEMEELLRKVLSEKSVITNYEITQEFPVIGERTMLINAREIVREEGGEKLILLVFGDITDKKLVEKSLEKSEIKFKLLVETLPQLIWIADATGQPEFFNAKWKEFTGATDADMEDERWLDFVHPNDRKRVSEHWRKCVRTGEPFSVEYNLKYKDGNYNWFLVKALPLFSTDGEIMKWFGSNTNIQIHKEAENALIKSSSQFRQFTEFMPEKVSNADPSGKVTYFNKSWENYSGWTREELVEKGWANLVHPDDVRNSIEKWNKSVETGEELEMEMRLRDRQGEYRWHLTRAICIKDEKGNIKQWIGATTEIERFKEEERRKEGFLQLVSHELKTPVTSIKGYVQLLLSMLQQESQKIESLPLEPSLRRIDEQIVRLTRLISEMLDISRIEENKLDLRKETFDINKFVEETVQDILRTEIDHQFKIQHEFNCKIKADKDRIGQVLINLITNAVKYSPDSKEIEIRLFESEDHKAAISISDKGIGISKRDQKEIFKRFHRVEGKNEDTYAGLGIGLFLAQEILERHGGSLTVESELGQGSIFTFTLPYDPEKCS